MKKCLTILFFALTGCYTIAQKPPVRNRPKPKIIYPGAYQTEKYFPLLTGMRVGLFANQTSVINDTHLVDTLIKSGILVTKIFGPEHGFRGTASAGEKIESSKDDKTGIPIISLYGKKRKPNAKDLEDVDILVFDIQDVGVRFYTYISSLQDFMETAIEFKKPLIILDRPNPNGFYVDGPVLDTAYRSFIGMQAVPVVYGMTIGEYAAYLVGERLLDCKSKPDFLKTNEKDITGKNTGDIVKISEDITVVKCSNYNHSSRYELPVKPSPNLPDAQSIFWYPSTCFFEGTNISEGRGTAHPFAIFGHPDLPKTMYSFIPKSNEGAKNPKLEGKVCYGWNLSERKIDKEPGKVDVQFLLEAYKLFPNKKDFFIQAKNGEYFFNKLAGNSELMRQIVAGKTEGEIRESWQPKLQAFKEIRSKYLLYADN